MSVAPEAPEARVRSGVPEVAVAQKQAEEHKAVAVVPVVV
jgi:hypothetical protein